MFAQSEKISSNNCVGQQLDNGDAEVFLVPFGNGAKYLNTIKLNRLHDGNQTVMLGRNIETGLDKSSPNVLYVSRSHVAIKVKGDGKVYLTVLARQERVVSLNGRVMPERMEVEMSIGSRFSLLGSIEWFNYELITATSYAQLKASTSSSSQQQEMSPVLIPQVTDGESSNKRKRESAEIEQVAVVGSEDEQQHTSKRVKIPAIVTNDAEMVPTQQITSNGNGMLPKNVVHGLFHQFDCPICYDTMASVCTLAPCGCNFCYHCIETWYCVKRKNICPCCNQKFELPKAVSNKRMDTVIRDFMKAMSVPKEDMDNWEDRVLVGIQRKQAYHQLYVAPVQAAAAAVVPRFAAPVVSQVAASATPAASAPVTREVLSELIRARAIQVIAAASLPANANNTVLQGRAQRAQVVLAQLERHRQQEQQPDANNAPTSAAQWAASILPQPLIPTVSSSTIVSVPTPVSV